MTISAVQSLYSGATDSTTSIASLLAQDAGAGGTASTDATATASASTDISGPGRLMGKLQKLQQTDPAKFQQVMTDMAAKLTALAQKQGGSTSSASAASGASGSQSLSDLAAKFTQAAQTGDLSAFRPPAPPAGTSAASAAGAYAQNNVAFPVSGHHHHHHGGLQPTPDASGSSDSASASISQDPLAGLFNQLSQATSGALQTAAGATTTPSTASTDPTGLSPVSNVYRLQKQVA